jgi:hypothetical protein
VTASVSRFAKLRAMSPRELLARVRYEGYTLYERQRFHRGKLAPPDRLRRVLVESSARKGAWQDELLSRAGDRKFFPSLEAPDAVRTLFEERYATEWQRSRATADEVARGEIGFFGRRFSFGPVIDWHADPVSGAVWPRSYHRDVPVHGGNVGFGDVKDVWEVNRHQFFIDLAKVAFLDRSVVHADALHRLLRHWMANVPYGTGAAWACALEPAFRAWSWLWAYHLVRDAKLLDHETHLIWLTGFHDHGRFLHRHLERYSSPYNHLIGEASALFVLGLLFPCFREAGAWTQRGRRILESTLPSQFCADGGTVEQSTFYHHATLGFYILAAILGRRNGADLSPGVWSAIERGIQFSAALVEPDGRLPRIGGADDGKPIRLEHLPFWDFRPYQAIGAVLFNRPDFKFVAGRFWEDALWVLGSESVRAFDQMKSQVPGISVALPDSGYFVLRSDWSTEADYLLFDCGQQAAGLRRDDVPSAAHGHADCLSVVVSLGGREVLVDPGFFCYNGDPQWEVHFRKTPAHNTIVVDGQDQARHVSKMAWTRTYEASVEGFGPEGRLGWIRGSHDGYARLANGVRHERTAWLRPGGYVVIRDELVGVGEHGAEAIFQFAPGHIELNESSVIFDDRYELSWACSAPVRARVSRGGDSPDSGWVAMSLGVREAAPRLAIEFPLCDGQVVLLTVLADRHRLNVGAPQVLAEASNGISLAASVVGDGFVDDVIAGVNGRVVTAGVETDATLVVVRRTGDRVVEALQAGGTHIRHLSADGARRQTNLESVTAR